jgi:hypothetical protein
MWLKEWWGREGPYLGVLTWTSSVVVSSPPLPLCCPHHWGIVSLLASCHPCCHGCPGRRRGRVVPVIVPTVASSQPLHRAHRRRRVVPAAAIASSPPLCRARRCRYVVSATIMSCPPPPLHRACRGHHCVALCPPPWLRCAPCHGCIVPAATVALSSPLRLCPPRHCHCVHPTVMLHRCPYPRILPAGIHTSSWRSGRIRGGVGFVVLLGLADVGDVAGLSRCGLVGLGDVAGSGHCAVVVE